MPAYGSSIQQSGVLPRILAVTHDILQARDLQPAVESIARAFGEVFHWRCVSIVATDEPEGELQRLVMWGFPDDIVRDHLGEIIHFQDVAEFLQPDYEVFPNCYYIAAEHAKDTDRRIYIGDLPRDGPRTDKTSWHERDALALVLADGDGRRLGYLSADHPADGKIPTRDILRDMQIFVNLVGLALTNARAHHVAIERRRMVEENARLQSDFFTIVAHEVRSPLAAIRGAASLISAHLEELSAERRTDLLGVLSSSTMRLSSIFEDFLLLSRMDAGQLTLRMQSADPMTLVEESVSRARSAHDDREFCITANKPLPSIVADEGRVVQILTNFLSNAVKYSPATSPVGIEIASNDGEVFFRVTNTGPGIRSKDRNKVFTRFGGVSQDEGATGLGLYISKQLVTLMGGRIGFDSVPMRRTSFWFALPSEDAQ
ncbi:MAG TPA: HAMP domain-containing sensor histidine kinase [Candidatus Baltobacteraceae bacterium]